MATKKVTSGLPRKMSSDNLLERKISGGPPRRLSSSENLQERKLSGGIPRIQSTDSLLDTADDLADKLDCLADILEEIDEKYSDGEDEAESEPDQEEESTTNFKLYRRLKDGLESARSLIGCLKREKWRLNRRKMSVELRMGELEDYKSHLKQDMTSLNDTVDMLSMRVIQLEDNLCEAQEIQEEMEAEKAELLERLTSAEESCRDLEKEKETLQEEVEVLRRSRSNSSLVKENEEVKSEMELLQEENHHLKEMIRFLEEEKTPQNQDGGANIVLKKIEYIDNNNEELTDCSKSIENPSFHADIDPVDV